MCGLFGWVANAPVADAERRLTRAEAALAHRGPDGRGRWRAGLRRGGEAALVHTRLSLVDAPGGAQPFVSGDGRFVVSFNGEIYNHPELRETLQGEGRTFVTRSDTEVLLEAWCAWGERALARFEGMFAFALFDTLTESLVLARDAFGEKPMFWAEAGGGIAFASEIAALQAAPGVSLRLDEAALPDYLLRRYVPAPETLFQGVRKLQPGALLIVEAGRIAERRWAAARTEAAPSDLGPAEAAETFARLFDRSITLRLRADAPVGVMLSGGLDSSAVAAAAGARSPGVRTFAVGFEEAASELPFAARAAEALGLDHEGLTVSAADFAEAWPRAVRHRGAPVSEASDIPLMLLSEVAARSVKAVLTGDGADELLAGYPKHAAERWTRAFHRAVSPERHAALIEPLVSRLPYGARRLRTLSRALAEPDPAARSVLGFASGSVSEIEALCGRPPNRPAGAGAGSALRQALVADQGAWLADNLLERDDRMTMAAGLEARAPFLDTEIAAFLAALPEGLLFDRRGGKAILRAAFEGRLPTEILYRRKSGFRTPIGDWLRGPLKPMLRDLLQGEGSRVRRMLRGEEIDRRLSEHDVRRTDQTATLWTLANLELFLKEFQLGV